MVKFTQSYPTNMKYTEWLLILKYFPENKMGRQRKWKHWKIIDAILYVHRTGCQWRMLPKDLSAMEESEWISLALEPLRSLGADQSNSG